MNLNAVPSNNIASYQVSPQKVMTQKNPGDFTNDSQAYPGLKEGDLPRLLGDVPYQAIPDDSSPTPSPESKALIQTIDSACEATFKGVTRATMGILGASIGALTGTLLGSITTHIVVFPLLSSSMKVCAALGKTTIDSVFYNGVKVGLYSGSFTSFIKGFSKTEEKIVEIAKTSVSNGFKDAWIFAAISTSTNLTLKALGLETSSVAEEVMMEIAMFVIMRKGKDVLKAGLKTIKHEFAQVKKHLPEILEDISNIGLV